MSAVSRTVTPSSSAASTTRRVPSRSTRRPKLLQPSPRTLTSIPESPSGRCCILHSMTPEEPEVADDYLEDWTPEPLVQGFVMEDARVRDAELSETKATAGRIAMSTLDGVTLHGSRLRSLSLI